MLPPYFLFPLFLETRRETISLYCFSVRLEGGKSEGSWRDENSWNLFGLSHGRWDWIRRLGGVASETIEKQRDSLLFDEKPIRSFFFLLDCDAENCVTLSLPRHDIDITQGRDNALRIISPIYNTALNSVNVIVVLNGDTTLIIDNSFSHRWSTNDDDTLLNQTRTMPLCRLFQQPTRFITRFYIRFSPPFTFSFPPEQ